MEKTYTSSKHSRKCTFSRFTKSSDIFLWFKWADGNYFNFKTLVILPGLPNKFITIIYKSILFAPMFAFMSEEAGVPKEDNLFNYVKICLSHNMTIYLTARLFHYMTVSLHDCLTTWLSHHMTISPHDCLTAWLSHHMTISPHDYLTTWRSHPMTISQ